MALKKKKHRARRCFYRWLLELVWVNLDLDTLQIRLVQFNSGSRLHRTKATASWQLFFIVSTLLYSFHGALGGGCTCGKGVTARGQLSGPCYFLMT